MNDSRRSARPGARRTVGYYLFYLIFSPDFWRLLIGIAAAAWLAPKIIRPDMTAMAGAMLYVMLATIGWAASGVPGRWICEKLKRLVLGARVPPVK